MENNIETKKVLNRIVRELTKDEEAQSIIDGCNRDLAEYYYWEYQEKDWEYNGLLKKAFIFLNHIYTRLKILEKVLEEVKLRYKLDSEIWGDTIITTHEISSEMARQEMLLNIKEQYGYFY